MDILKKSLMTVVAAMSLFLFAACNFELKNDDGKSAPQKEEQKEEPVKEEPQKEEPVEKVIAATYTNKDAELFGIEVKIDFYTDGSWLAYDVLLEDGESMAFIDLYKGTFEGTSSEDGTLKIKITDYSDAAKFVEDDKMSELLTYLDSKIDLETAVLPVKYEVKWSAYENPEEKSYSVEKGKLTLFGGDFFRDGYTPDETETDPIEDPENDNPVEEPTENPTDDPVEPPLEDPEEKPDDTEVKKTLVAKYISKKDSVTSLILTVEFYSDGSWLAYDDIHGVETSADSEGNSESKEYTFAYVDLYKGTYTGNPAEDGKITIVTTHNTVISNLRSISTIYDYYGEIESNIGKDAELPVRFTDTWLSSAKVETEVTISKGKMNVFDTDLYKDGKYEDESETGEETPVEEPEVTKELVARYLGYDDIGNVFIDLYNDGSFLAYDKINMGNNITMILDLYKGTYQGNPAEDGAISFNISHVSSVIGQTNAKLIALMTAQIAEAGEDAVYPMRVNSEWVEYPFSAAVIVKNGRANVLGFDVIREGTEDSGNSEETLAELDSLFSAEDCTIAVNPLSISDGNWTMKTTIVSDDLARITKSLYSTILNNFTEPEQQMIHSWELSDEEIEEKHLTTYAEDYVFLKLPGKTFSIKEYDFSVDKTKEGSDDNKITITKNVSTFILSTDGDVFAKKFYNITYDVYGLPRAEWKGTYTIVQTEEDLDYDHDKGLIADMVISGRDKYEWKSDADQIKIFGTEKYIKDENSIYIMKKE